MQEELGVVVQADQVLELDKGLLPPLEGSVEGMEWVLPVLVDHKAGVLLTWEARKVGVASLTRTMMLTFT